MNYLGIQKKTKNKNWTDLNVFFPPLPKVGCPKLFEIWGSLGKSNGKKWSQIWKLSLKKGVESPGKNISVLGEFCLTEQDVLVLCFSLLLTVFLPPFPIVRCPNLQWLKLIFFVWTEFSTLSRYTQIKINLFVQSKTYNN